MTNYFSIQQIRMVDSIFTVLKKIPLCMRLTAILLFAFIGLAHATESYSQSTVLTLNVNNRTVQEVLDEIEKQSDFHFFYNNKQVNTSRIVTIKSNKRNVFNVLEQLFSGTDISYKVLDKSIILSPKELISDAVAQQTIKNISGTVKDVNGEPIIGANVVEKGSTNGVITDENGKFNLSLPSKSILKISFIGYITKEIPVASTNVFNVQLVENTQAIDEVVVTALGIKREEKALGYAVQKVGGDKLSTVKTVDIGTSLTGKVAGLNVQNSTEFNAAPSLLLRGESPLVVIDGVPYGNINLRDIAADDIESVDVLKGATASALYGARGGVGVVMVTTKRGKEEGLNISINSSTMFQAGYLKLPEAQHSYSTGQGGYYNASDFVWGDKMDIGRTAEQWDPIQQKWVKDVPLVSKGKDNFKNFLETSFITNNNISITQKGKYGSFRTSLTHVYNKGQYPNTKLNKINYTVAGDMKWKKFTFEGGMTYNKRFFPNDKGAGYGGSGYLYNLLVWTGTDYDIRDYKNYWVKKDEEQNWMNSEWYDNPYFIANEITRSSDYSITNGFLYTTYEFTPWLKASLRSGIDIYSERKEWKNPVSARGGWHKNGYYEVERNGGYSMNHDLILNADHKFGDFSVDGFIGGTLYYYQDDRVQGNTKNGLSIPGYYSLKASVDPAQTSSSFSRKQVNSLYARASASWKSTVFVDVTARNDWASTLPKESRSYFYPSVSGSIVLSEFIPLPEVFNFWKVRGSWTQTKKDLSVYEINSEYSMTNDAWDGLNSASYPTSIRGMLMKPSASRSWEIGTAFSMLNNRLRVDVAYYNTLKYNMTRKAGISSASGFSETLINYQEEQLRKGFEVMLSGDVIKTKNFEWNSTFNWALDRYYYAKVDPKYSTQRSWVAAGERWDWLGVNDWERDPQGNIIHEGGLPKMSNYNSVAGYEFPDWVWGFNNTFRYKDFTLNFTIDGRVGGVAFNKMNQALWNTGAHPDSDNQWRYEQVVERKNNYVGQGVKIVSGKVERDTEGNITSDTRVFAPNDTEVSYETYIRNYHVNAYTVTSQNIYDQTFIKLRDLSLSYAMPKSVYSKLKLKGLSVGFVGQNLLIWTKEFKFSDPDVAKDDLNSPSVRYVGFNLKLDL